MFEKFITSCKKIFFRYLEEVIDDNKQSLSKSRARLESILTNVDQNNIIIDSTVPIEEMTPLYTAFAKRNNIIEFTSSSEKSRPTFH